MTSLTAQQFDVRVRSMTPVSAPPEQRAGVAAIAEMLVRSVRATKRERQPQCKLIGPQGDSIPLPESVFFVLERVAQVLARGDAVTVVPVGKELTTQQAADLLNISRQYLVRLLDQNVIPHRKTGKHRRLRIEDVLTYKQERDEERETALDELTKMSEDAGGYDELK